MPARVERIAVYVHVPFCSSRCNYCDFYFETGWSPRVMRHTLARVEEEARFFYDAMGRPPVRTLYYGGGTPSTIPPRLLALHFRQMAAALDLATGRPVEWTFEANPESMSDELLDVLLAAGITRVSLGVQSFDDRILAALTRRAHRDTVERALSLLSASRSSGRLAHLNVDLMTGVPGQREETLFADIDRVVDSLADHVSLYSLTLEERTPLAQAARRGDIGLPAADTADALWLSAKARLEDAGFVWYEISNFARDGGAALLDPGIASGGDADARAGGAAANRDARADARSGLDARSRHNRAYWRMEPYLGLGPGAASTLPMVRAATAGTGGPDGVVGIAGRAPAAHYRGVPGTAPAYRLRNPNLFQYAATSQRAWAHEVEPLTPRDLLVEHLLTGLRTADGVSLVRLAEIFEVDFTERWSAQLAHWVESGILDEPMLSGPRRSLVLRAEARVALDRHLLSMLDWVDRLEPLRVARWP